MAQLIQPCIDTLIALLKPLTFAPDPQLAVVKESWTGTVANPPECSVMPVRTSLGAVGDNWMRDMTHLVTIRLAIVGSADAEELTRRVVRYVRAIDCAITKSFYGDPAHEATGQLWPASVKNVIVAEHDYGPMYSRGNGLCFFPDLHVQIQAKELIP